MHAGTHWLPIQVTNELPIPSSPVIALSEDHIIGVHIDDLQCNYSVWFPAWKTQLEGLPKDVKVSPAAMAISTPLDTNN